MPIFIMASRSQPLSVCQRICSGCAVLVGGFASVMSVMRVLYTVAPDVGHEDYLVPLSVLECGTAIIAASAATLQPLFPCLAPHSSASSYIDRSASKNRPDRHHGPFMYGTQMPSKSHFSLFSEASFGPKTWFKGLHDNAQPERAADENIWVLRSSNGSTMQQKSTLKVSNNKLVISHPIVATAPPPPLNRTESQQYLLRNDRDSSAGSGTVSRQTSSSKPLFVYEGDGSGL